MMQAMIPATNMASDRSMFTFFMVRCIVCWRCNGEQIAAPNYGSGVVLDVAASWALPSWESTAFVIRHSGFGIPPCGVHPSTSTILTLQGRSK